MIRQNSLSIPVADYGWWSLSNFRFGVPIKCLCLGASYLLNKILKKDADKETIKHRAGFVKDFPYRLFEECSLKKLAVNANFMYCLGELATVKGLNKNVVIVTRNMESLVESYLNSVHEFGIPVHQYIEEAFGFKFVIVGNELEVAEYAGERRVTGVIAPGSNAAVLLGDSLISMLTKIGIYSGKIILSDREEISNRDVRKQGKNGDFLLVNLQAPHFRIRQKLYSCVRFLQNKYPVELAAVKNALAVSNVDCELDVCKSVNAGDKALQNNVSNGFERFNGLNNGFSDLNNCFNVLNNHPIHYDSQVDALVGVLRNILGENLLSVIGYGSYFRRPSKPNRRPDLIVVVDDYSPAYDSLGDLLFWSQSMKAHNVELNTGSINYYNLKLDNMLAENPAVGKISISGEEFGRECSKFKIGIISKEDLAKKASDDFYVSGRLSKENVPLYYRSKDALLFMQAALEAVQERFVHYACMMCSGRTTLDEFLTKYLAISYLAEPYRWFDRNSASAILDSELGGKGRVFKLLFEKIIKYIPSSSLDCSNGSMKDSCMKDGSVEGRSIECAAKTFYFRTSWFKKATTYFGIILQGFSGFSQSWKNHFETNKKYSNDPIIPKEYFREKRRRQF